MTSIAFRDFLSEAKDQLDISIQAAGKYLTTTKKIEEFLQAEVTVEHKTDGVKLTVIKQADNGNLEDYIVAYKGNILYSGEYDYQPNTKIKKEAIGASQFKMVFQHLMKLGKTGVPVGTELFIEFLMSKPTLSSAYSTKHKMVLIGSSPSTWVEKFGKLKTSPQGLDTKWRDQYAKKLKIDVPQHLFQGVLGSELQFGKGIKNAKLQKEFSARKGSMTWGSPEILLDDIRELFLSVESKYGGQEEGVVLKYSGRLLKFQQEYQLDQAARAVIKQKYREPNPEQETEYWEDVKRAALEIASGITVKSRKLPDLMQELSLVMKRWKPTFEHSRKTPAIIKDDIQLTAKTQIIKGMRGNNNALILGKFRVLTKEGHFKLIKRASTLYDNVVVCVVTGSDTKDTKALRTEMVQKAFPGVEIVHSSNGHVARILGTSPININVVYAGSDRVQGYRDQLKHSQGVTVKEMPRTDSDISASKVIANIEDEGFFTKHTPKSIHGMYDKLRKQYGS